MNVAFRRLVAGVAVCSIFASCHDFVLPEGDGSDGSESTEGGTGPRNSDGTSGGSGEGGSLGGDGAGGTENGAGGDAGGDVNAPYGGDAGTPESGAGGEVSAGGAPAETCAEAPIDECSVTLWPSGNIAYAFSDGWPPAAETEVLRAMAQWEQLLAPTVRFVPSDGALPAVRLVETGCRAARGRTGDMTEAFLGDCSARETLVALGRIIGLGAQHLRFDRDRYLQIPDSMCTPGEFEPEPLRCHDGETTDLGPYDTHSVMHPASEDFEPGCMARDDCRVTDRSGQPIPQTQSIAPSDVAAVLELYAEQRGWSRFRPVVGGDAAETEPLQDGLGGSTRPRGQPALVTVEEHLEAFVLGDDGVLYTRVIDAENTLSGAWEALDFSFEAPPAGAYRDGALELVGVGEASALKSCVRDGAEWLPCEEIGSPSGGGPVGVPSLVKSSAERLDLFVVRDTQLFWRHKVQAWSEQWVAVRAGFMGGPVAASWAPGRIDLMGKLTPTGTVLATTFLDNVWLQAEFHLGGYLDTTSGVALASGREFELDLFGLDHAGVLMRVPFRPWFWRAWERIGGLLAGTPAAAALNQRIYVLAEMRGAGLWLGSWRDAQPAP